MLRITNDMDAVRSSDNAVVAFTATWCGPCTQMKPHFAKVAVQDNKTDYFVIDIDKIDKQYLEEYSIRGVPAVFKMSRGEIAKRISSRTASDMLKEIRNEEI